MFFATSLIRQDGEYRGVLDALRLGFLSEKPLPIAVNGLSGGSTTAFLAEAVRDARTLSGAPVLVLAGGEEERAKLSAALSAAGLSVGSYPARELVFHNISASHDTERERLAVLSTLLAGGLDAVVTTPSAALLYTMPKTLLSKLFATYRAGDVLSPESLSESLLTLGYARVDLVDGAGQFARRGGIVDFYPNAGEDPLRVEFFGDEIDRIATFDPITQRTLSQTDAFSLKPAAEVLLSPDARERVKRTVRSLLSTVQESEAQTALGRELSVLDSGLPVDFRDKYLSLIYDEATCLFDYLSAPTAVFTVDTAKCREELSRAEAELSRTTEGMLAHGVLPRSARFSAGEAGLTAFSEKNPVVHVNAFAGGIGGMRLSGLFGFRVRRTVAYGDNPSMLREDLVAYRKGLYRTLLVTETRTARDALIAALAEDGISAAPVAEGADPEIAKAEGGQIYVAVGELPEGYELLVPKIAVLSMKRDEGRAVMARRRKQRILRKAGGAGQRLMSYADLSVGDYVVHENYGIGLFEGIETVTAGGMTRDYIRIRYAGTDTLFVPCERLEVIGKYIGAHEEDGTVKLSKMGGNDWTRAKSRAKSAAKDIAKDLIALYAERQRKPGFAFYRQTEMEDEFAAAFPFEETESQRIAIEEIRADMEKPVPMNRLLCGDVGFGKTEVALRAAFKAVTAGKQVAILVPTTILALQHYETATSRMRGYPVTVEMLSRFRTPKQQAEILKKTKQGGIDILIGTHKLFSKDLEFRDLGLLVVDEEQRFGVAQKEKLKEIARNVDVLSLSATPIPRTLNMAMNGISDISLLDEAPGDRRPVQTYVLEHDNLILFDAIRKELARGGQVLYLYNRIDDIEYRADGITAAIPEARVAVAHGRMEKDELEDIWQTLVRGEIDVLVCTTIVETGVDLPNANTLIIEDADRMGLSQLHQIRGRVGRSTRQAYAYFTYRPGKALSEVAEKRLSTIREFAEFGAGFKIAMRDLEIRGAGNLLGAEQHGYIESVGYDLYVKLLAEAVLEEKGETKTQEADAAIEIKVDAHIPGTYIPASAQRMEMYKKISLIRDEEDYRDVTDEFLDRFGEPPKVTARLVDISLLRALASEAGIAKVSAEEGSVLFHTAKPDLSLWSEVFGERKGLEMRTFPTPAVRLRLAAKEDPLAAALGVMRLYHRHRAEENAVKTAE